MILGPVDPDTSRGLEIGPLDKAIVPREGGRAIWYADHADTAALREKYDPSRVPDSDHRPEDFVEVDFVLAEGPLAALADGVAPFDYVVASHVVEHVPDVVAWFDELSSVLVTGGRLCLAVPDRRYCMDARRASSDLADVVAAHLEEHTRPSPRAFFDYALHYTALDVPAAWRGDVPDDAQEDVGSVYRRTRDYARTADYVDVHVWTFTPPSFEMIVNALGAMELTDLRIEELHETPPGGGEFFARLAKRERTSAVGPIVLGVGDAELRQVQAEREALRARLHAGGRARRLLRHPLRALGASARRRREPASGG
jgi:SAM-dependent methyltransferase